nr:MAG TPA: hypothetical protein [Caudoviricetes sp.]
MLIFLFLLLLSNGITHLPNTVFFKCINDFTSFRQFRYPESCCFF